jgi:UDP-2,3-diacylglucosamine hydrolase
MARWRRLGIIAGGGALPLVIAEHCAETGAPYFVARVAPYFDPALDAHPGQTHDVTALSARIAALKNAGCDAIVFAGRVPRPDFSKLAIAPEDQAHFAALAAAAPAGDDALLRELVQLHVAAGFGVVGAEAAVGSLLAPAGRLGAHAPDAMAMRDIARAAHVAAAVGALDIGQGAVVCAGLVLAVEAQEGTDAMLARVATLREAVRGTRDARRGVLVKRPKPMQERRIDLPTIGEATIAGAAEAGLAGVAIEAGGAIIMRRGATIAAADAAGLFVYGFAPAEVGEA